MNITDKINKLSDMEDQLALHESQYAELRNSVIPAEVRAKLDEIDAECAASADIMVATLAALREEIKRDVLLTKQSAEGEHKKVMFYPGNETWDTRKLEKHAEKHPEILYCKKQGAEYVKWVEK